MGLQNGAPRPQHLVCARRRPRGGPGREALRLGGLAARRRRLAPRRRIGAPLHARVRLQGVRLAPALRAERPPDPARPRSCRWGSLRLGRGAPRPLRRRCADRGRQAVSRMSSGVGTLCLSLFMLGLVDTAALLPFASAAAATSNGSAMVRMAMGIVAVAGLAACVLITFLPRMAASGRLLRYRIVRWVNERTTSPREAWRAWVLVGLSWLARAVGLFLLLGALGNRPLLSDRDRVPLWSGRNGCAPDRSRGCSHAGGCRRRDPDRKRLCDRRGGLVRRRRAGASHPRGRRRPHLRHRVDGRLEAERPAARLRLND